MDLNTAKNLGGVGALLMFLSVLPIINFYGIISLVGLILVLIGAKGLADYYQEGGIFNNAIYGVVLTIVGIGAFIAVFIYALAGFLTDLGLGGFGFANFADITSFATSITAMDPNAIMNIFFSWIGYILVAALVLFIFVVLAAVFYRKSMSLTARKTGVGLFGTAGLITLIGAVLTIIFFGVFLLWIALLLVAIAFFQIKPQATAPPPPQM